jgi:hypothetical protein
VILAAIAILTSSSQGPALKPYALPFGLTISLPAQPVDKSKPGGSMKAFASIYGKSVFVIGGQKISSDPKQGAPDQQLAASVVGSLDSYHGKLTSFSDIMLKGWPGLDYKISASPISTWQRSIFVDGQLILIGVTYPTASGIPAYAQKVFDSASLAATTKQGPLAKPGIHLSPLKVSDMSFVVDMPGTPTDNPLNVGSGTKSLIMHRFVGTQDLRDFMFGYTDSMGSDMDKATAEDMKHVREFVANSIFQMVHASGELKSVTRDGMEWTTSSFPIEDSSAGRADVLVYGERVYFLLCTGPAPWMKSPEFDAFFDSFKPG